MNDPAAPLIVLIAILYTVGIPIIAILAYIRSARLERAMGGTPKLIGRIYDAEQRLNAVEKRVAALALNMSNGSSEASGPGFPASTPVVAPRAPNPPAAPPSSAPPQPPPRTDAEIRPAAPAAPLAVAPPAAAAIPPPRPPVPPPAPASPAASESVHAAPPPQQPSAPPPPSPPRVPPQPPIFSSSPPPNSRRGNDDVETVIAGRWLNYVGILALALAVSFFLKYAFDNNWIGPGGRVTLGLLVGSLLYPFGQRLYRKGYVFYSEGITALGAVILYLSVWAGWHYYHIFPQGYAFPMMIIITAVTAVVAVARDSERLAFLSAVGGLLTPVLVSTGENAETVLFGYLLILGAGMLVISFLKDWKTLPPLQFVATLIYFWSWYAEFYANYELGQTIVYATLFFALFGGLPAVRSSRGGELTVAEVWMVLSNATQFLIALRLMLWPDNRWELTFFLVALAVAHLLAERAVPRKNARSSQVARTVYTGLALTFLTLTIPIRLEGKWITIAWAVEGALLVWNGLQIRSRALRSAGLVLFLVVGIRLIAYPIQAEPVFLMNSRFLTIAMCAASFLAAYTFAASSNVELETGETQIYLALGGAANLLFLVGLSMEVWDLYGRMPSLGIDRALAQELALSVLWLLYASGLMAAGMIWKSASLRWQGLGLLGVVIAKVFFFDLSFLTRFYRILSFFLLGLVLLVISFLYQRRARPNSGE